MKINIHSKFPCALIALFTLSISQNTKADQIGVIYVKNSHDRSVSVWINGYYQGWVPSGKTCYTVREGFVTRDSGIDSAGNLKMQYDYAGWESRGEKITVTSMGYGEGEKSTVFWEADFVEGDSQFLGSGKARFWVGTKTPVTGLDMERATKIRKGGSGNFKLTDATGKTPAENVEGGGYDGGRIVAYKTGGNAQDSPKANFAGKWIVESSVFDGKSGKVMIITYRNFQGIELFEKGVRDSITGDFVKITGLITRNGTRLDSDRLLNYTAIGWIENKGAIKIYSGRNLEYSGKIDGDRLVLNFEVYRHPGFPGTVTLKRLK